MSKASTLVVHIALIRGLEEALEPKINTQKAWTNLQEPVKKVKAKGMHSNAE